MAGGKETPRQRMIGMMYLVLTALLALQVSNQILQKFILLNNGMETTSKNYANKNQFMIEQMQLTVNSTGNKEEDVKLLTAAKEVRKTTQELYTFIEDLKKELIIQSNAKDENGNFLTGALKNVEASGNIFVNNNKGEELKKKLNDFPVNLNKTLSTAAEPKIILEIDPLARDASEIDLFKNDMEARSKSFVTLNFVKSPVGAVLAILSQYQNAILNIESDALTEIQKRIGGGFTPIDQFNAKISAVSNTVAEGTKFTAEMFLAASSSFSLPTMTVNGSPIPVDANGIGKIEFEASPGNSYVNGQAKKVLTAKITNSSNGKNKSYDLTYEYTVVKPVIKVSSKVVQQLYAECANELQIDVPSLGNSYRPIFEVTNGQKASGSAELGKITIYPGPSGQVSIKVFNQGPNQSNLIGTETFDIKPVPNPKISLLLGAEELDLKKSQTRALLSNLKVVATAEANFANTLPKEKNYDTPVGSILLVRNDKEIAQVPIGGSLNSLLQNAVSGDIITVEVKAVYRNSPGLNKKVKTDLIESKSFRIK